MTESVPQAVVHAPITCLVLQAVTIIGGGRVGLALADMGDGSDVSHHTRRRTASPGMIESQDLSRADIYMLANHFTHALHFVYMFQVD